MSETDGGMTPAEMNATSALLGRARGLLPNKALAKALAKLAVAIDRASAIKTINKWTPEEAKKLGLFRCDNAPHDGQIVYYEEHGRENTAAGLVKKLRCPVCNHQTHHMIEPKRRASRSPYMSGRDIW